MKKVIVLSKDDPSPFLPVSDDETVPASDEKETSEEITMNIDIEKIANRIIRKDVPDRN